MYTVSNMCKNILVNGRVHEQYGTNWQGTGRGSTVSQQCNYTGKIKHVSVLIYTLTLTHIDVFSNSTCMNLLIITCTRNLSHSFTVK